MFCGECGTKNEEGALFCENCGAKLVEEKPAKQPKKVSNSKQASSESFGTKLKKMSMVKKILLGVALAIVIILIVAYAVINNKLSPKKIAKDYFMAVVNMDTDKLYQYMDIDKNEFTSKEMFDKLAENNLNDDKIKLANYKMGNVEKSNNGLTATVTISYVEEGDDDTETVKVTLVKQKSKKYLFFEDWHISNSMSVMDTTKDYKIKVLKDSKVTIEGIEVDKKYIDKDSSDGTYDVYKMPAMFKTKYNMKIELPLGFEVEDTLNLSSYYSSYTYSLNEDKLPENVKKQLIETTKKGIQTLYNGAKDQKPFDEIKNEFEYEGSDLSNLKKTYESLSKSLSGSDLSAIEFTAIELDSFTTTEKGFRAYIDADYKYTVSYTSGSETKTHDSNSSDSMTIYYSYSDNAFKITDAGSLVTYFSRYY